MPIRHTRLQTRWLQRLQCCQLARGETFLRSMVAPHCQGGWRIYNILEWNRVYPYTVLSVSESSVSKPVFSKLRSAKWLRSQRCRGAQRFRVSTWLRSERFRSASGFEATVFEAPAAVSSHQVDSKPAFSRRPAASRRPVASKLAVSRRQQRMRGAQVASKQAVSRRPARSRPPVASKPAVWRRQQRLRGAQVAPVR